LATVTSFEQPALASSLTKLQQLWPAWASFYQLCPAFTSVAKLCPALPNFGNATDFRQLG
jgi:hypothetical protein